MNENIPRWLWASITKHIDSKRQNILLVPEGYDTLIQAKDSFKIRINGPVIHEPSKDYFIIDVGINVLVTSIKDEADDHKIHKLCGIIVAAYTNEIKVFKYGNTNVVDDNSLLGCLILQDKIIVTHFGSTEVSSNILQSTVESEYRLQL